MKPLPILCNQRTDYRDEASAENGEIIVSTMVNTVAYGLSPL
jgi:hypothetical protein